MRDDIVNRKAMARAERAKAMVKDRRRVRVGKPVSGVTGRPVPPDTQRTVYPASVRDPEPGQPVLMCGGNNPKIGGDVLIGRLKGAKVYTLALEERATCPRSCFHWTTCYGNQSPFVSRWRHGPKLEEALRLHIQELARQGLLLVRLHMLGDFYSWRYLCLWADLLDKHPGLHVFGFTAHKRGTKLGEGIATLRGVYPDRFAMRHSNALGQWGSATIDFPTERRFIGDAVVCPEQLDANRDSPRGVHCGSCALCWESERAVIFIEHGYKRPPPGRPKKETGDAEA